MTRFLLVRHGETEWTRARRIQGQRDTPLTPLGLRQAERLGERLRGEDIDAVYSSDLGRAMETARLVVPGLPVERRPELRECAFGEVEGQNFAWIQQNLPAVARHWLGRWPGLAFPGGETLATMLGRTSACFRELRRHHPRGTVLVVAHDGPLRSGICALMGWGRRRWWNCRLAPASLTVIETRPLRLLLFNDTCHLEGLEPEAGR